MSILDSVKKYDRVALLLQGGGALGSYQAGIYEVNCPPILGQIKNLSQTACSSCVL